MDTPSSFSTDLDTRVGGDEGLSVLDTRMLRLAADRKSPEEIGLELNIPPERAAQRIRDILHARDWLSVVERKALIVDDMMELKSYIRDMMDGQINLDPYVNDRGHTVYPQADPRWASEMLKLVKELSRQVELDSASVDSAMTQIRQAHAKVMYQAVSNAFDRLMFGIRTTYPDVDEAVLMRFMEDALPKAMEAIEARTAA